MVELAEITNLRLLRQSSHRRALLSRAQLRLISYLPEDGRRALFRGRKHYCPTCDSWVSRFLTWRLRVNAWCPVCASMSRHRFTWLFLQRRTNLFEPAPKRVLHVAPEPGFERRLRLERHLDYLTADLMDSGAMTRMDITDIRYPDTSFDVICCSHVLEHVPDPARALREFRRVLKPDGWALLVVPVWPGPTVGDPAVTDPAERERRFGQHDHYWRFGCDFVDWLTDAGFAAETIQPPEVADADECRIMALPAEEPIFYCRPAA